jgi:hypothetical protein
LGDAFVTFVIAKGVDIHTVVHAGRHIPAEIKTALIVAGKECAIEGCHTTNGLQHDHSELDFAKGGPTSLANLQFLCVVHHRRKTLGYVLGPRNPVTGKRTLTEPARAG